jgi:hypothetical protein
MEIVILGDTVKVILTFEVDGVLTDPTTVTLRVKPPTGATSAYTGADLDHVSDGAFAKRIVLDAVGDWWLRGEGTGVAAGVVEKLIRVDGSHVL